MTRFSTRLLAPVALGIATLGITACSQEPVEPGTTSEDQTDSTIADILGGAGELSTVAKALDDAGLDEVFDGPGSYTILAPNDAAFEALGEAGAELLTEENRPVMIAILREHVVPGHLTIEAINEAIEQNGGPVEMRTVGGGLVTFSAQPDGLGVSGEDGETIEVSSGAMAGSNGVIMPVDGLLVNPAPADQP